MVRSFSRLAWRTARGVFVTLRILARDSPLVLRDARAAYRLMTGPQADSLTAADAIQLVRTARRYGLDAHDLWMVWTNYTDRNLEDAVTKALEMQALYRRAPGPATLN